MSVEFENAILAGVTLIREAIQSQNYEEGVDGWQIAADGKAEFSDLTIRSSDGSGTTVVIASGEIKVLDGAGNVVVEIDSTGYRLYNASGLIVAEIKLDGGGLRGGFYTRNFAFPQNVYAYLSGGQITSGPVENSFADIHGFLQYVMTATAPIPYAVQTLSTGTLDVTLDDPARVQLVSERGQVPRVWVDGGSPQVKADLIVTGAADVRDTRWISYTPAVTGCGSGTFTSRIGWYSRNGKRVDFTAEFQMNAAGTGTDTVQVAAPTAIYRGTRQVFAVHVQGVYVSGLVANGSAVSLASSSGVMIDRISVSNNSATNRDNIVQGSMLTAGAIVTITGSYREV